MHSLSLCERCMVMHSEHWPRQQLGRVALQPLYTIVWCFQGLFVIGYEVIKGNPPFWFGEEVSAVATQVLRPRPLFAWCIEWFTILNVQFWDLQYIYFPELQRLLVCKVLTLAFFDSLAEIFGGTILDSKYKKPKANKISPFCLATYVVFL